MDIRDVAVKAAAIKAVRTATAEAEAEVKAWLETELDPGDRKGAKVGEESVATISYSKSSATAKITDPAAFLGWVVRNQPDQLRRRVVVSAFDLGVVLHPDGYLSDARDDAHERLQRAIDASELEVEPGYATKVLAAAVKDKGAFDHATGEEIPGITYIPGGAGLAVSVRQDDAQRAALVAAWQRGDLDLLDLATTPLELEAATE